MYFSAQLKISGKINNIKLNHSSIEVTSSDSSSFQTELYLTLKYRFRPFFLKM